MRGALTLISLALALAYVALGPGYAEASRRRIHVSEDSGLDFDADQAPGPMEWPHLLGATGEEAKEAIEADSPDLKVSVVPHGAMVTMDHRTDRVRIFVDEGGKVSRVPRIG